MKFEEEKVEKVFHVSFFNLGSARNVLQTGLIKIPCTLTNDPSERKMNLSQFGCWLTRGSLVNVSEAEFMLKVVQ